MVLQNQVRTTEQLRRNIALQFCRKPTIPIKLSEKGFSISKRQILPHLGTLVRQMNIKTPFRNGIIGKDLKKKSCSLIRNPVKLLTVRSRMLNATVVGNYFKVLKTAKQLHLYGIWMKLGRISNTSKPDY